MRLALLVRPGEMFVKLVFALLRSGAVTVFVDPGMGRQRLLDCLESVEPSGFVAVSAAQAVRSLFRRRFPAAILNVTEGLRLGWGGVTCRQLLKRGRLSHAELPATSADQAAAIIFTSGSTGPPKGVLYTHGMFEAQVAEIQARYGLAPGGADLACFPLFGLFNSAMGVATIFPQMDFSRPASCEPKKLLAAANDWQIAQAFASPAVWNKVSRYCENTGRSIPTLRKVFSCGAPVPADVLKRTLACVHPDAEMHTPYGATEALPVATIEAREVINETNLGAEEGAGVCVGR
ncbi:MAG: AMP-binding protein, partial [Planctomycetota bacterium]